MVSNQSLFTTYLVRLRPALFLILWLLGCCSYADSIGYIKQVSGTVKLYRQGEFKAKNIISEQLPATLFAGDKVRSKGDSEAVIYLQDGSTVMLTPRSMIIFHQQYDHFIEEGKILYDVRKQGGASGLIVATKSATIGVKGTQFMVKSNAGQQSIYLKRGLITVEAIADDFERSLASELSQFERYSQELESGFEQYKAKLEKEYIEYVKSISMNAGQAINISAENALTDIAFTAEDEDDFSQLEQWRQH